MSTDPRRPHLVHPASGDDLALLHLHAARTLAGRVAAAEATGDPSAFDEVWALSVGCVHACLAAVDAFTNTIARAPAPHFPDVPAAALDAVMRRTARDTTLDKLDLFLSLRGAAALHRGRAPVQDFVLVGRLRNHLVAFQPDWDWIDPGHAKLTRQLAERVPPSPLVPDAPHFPRAWATHAAARWAVGATRETLALVEREARWPARFSRLSVDP